MRPQLRPVYVLIHSPLVGEMTWKLVAEEMRQRDQIALVPTLRDIPDSKQPYWQQHASSVVQVLVDVPKAVPFILVAHSGAGPLLPAIRQLIPNRIHAYVFVDAGIPRDGATRLDLMESEDPGWTREFKSYLERSGRFPNWTADDLDEIIPDKNMRQQLVNELHPRGLEFFSESIPVFEGWPDAQCMYIQFSATYEKPAAEARKRNWVTHKLKAGHFHMLVDPKAVTELIIDSVTEISNKTL